MKRREFLVKTGCAFAGLVATPAILKQGIAEGMTYKRKYKIDIEIYERKGYCYYGHNKIGIKFKYPNDWERICPYLRGSLALFIEQLEAGKTLSWTYMGTPYEKVINQNGITTEYVRCPDPSENTVVAKITRTNNI